nr:MAG TPA: hypothetical protein [Caudoviricetes sp.]
MILENSITCHKKASQAKTALCEMGLLCTYEHNH